MADIKIKKVEDTVIKTSKDIGIVSEKFEMQAYAQKKI